MKDQITEKELRKACCWQRAHGRMFKELESFTSEFQKVAKEIAKDLIEAQLRDGVITEEQAKQMYLDLKV